MIFLPLDDTQLDYIARTIGQRPYMECAGIMQLIQVTANNKEMQMKLLAALAGPLDTPAQAASNVINDANSQAASVAALQASLDSVTAQLEAAAAAQAHAAAIADQEKQDMRNLLNKTNDALEAAQAKIKELETPPLHSEIKG